MALPCKEFALSLLSAMSLLSASIQRVAAEPAPVPRLIIEAASAPESLNNIFSNMKDGRNDVRIDGASWLQFTFSDYDLGDAGSLTIVGEDGQSQTFTQEKLEEWDGNSAIFNGSKVAITVTFDGGDERSVRLDRVSIGTPVGPQKESVGIGPEPLRNLLGNNLNKFRPRAPESICGISDDRVASVHPMAGRIMPVGCTGWIIDGGSLLTAGHCVGPDMKTIEFNVPSSLPNGVTVSPPPSDQYKIIQKSIKHAYTGIGNDWAVFKVTPNTETGKMPIEAQGGGFRLARAASPTTVEIAGFGVDGPSPRFGNPPPRNADNQTQQIHSGTLTGNSTNGPNSAWISYQVDTQGGNSGSPVFGQDGGNVAIGIHTNGGCGASSGENYGTSFRHQALWSAIQAQ